MMMEGKLVVIRPIELYDSKNYAYYINSEQIKDYLNVILPYNEMTAEEWIRKNAVGNNILSFSIETKEANNLYIGNTFLFGIDWIARSAEYGIAIYDPAFRNKGLGTETTKLMLKYAFEYLNLNRVWLRVYETNHRAIHTFEKCGFIFEGRMRQGRYYKGQYSDIIIMGLLSDEYWRMKSEY